MNIFWISLILFALLLGATVVNAYYVRGTVSKMQQLLREAEDVENQEEAIASLTALWEKHRDIIGFSAGAHKIEQIETLMTELRFAYESMEENDFQKSRLLLLAATEELIRYETVSMEAIF